MSEIPLANSNRVAVIRASLKQSPSGVSLQIPSNQTGGTAQFKNVTTRAHTDLLTQSTCHCVSSLSSISCRVMAVTRKSSGYIGLTFWYDQHVRLRHSAHELRQYKALCKAPRLASVSSFHWSSYSISDYIQPMLLMHVTAVHVIPDHDCLHHTMWLLSRLQLQSRSDMQVLYIRASLALRHGRGVATDNAAGKFIFVNTAATTAFAKM